MAPSDASRRDGGPVYNIPAHAAFVDALAQGLIARCPDPLALARAHVFLPNRRAVRALTEAFVRVAGGGLLLPRMTPVGDLGDDSFDRFASGGTALPPQVPPLRRRLELARLVRAMPGNRSAVEALRLGDQLGATLDDLLAEEISPERLRGLMDGNDLADHWTDTFAFLDIVISQWPPARDALGGSDGGTRLAALIDALIARWRDDPPSGLVVAAGITGSSPPLVRLLAAIRGLPRGLIVLPGLDDDQSPAGTARWEAIRCRLPGEESLLRDSEEHPQYALKALLGRLGVTRDAVRDWGVATPQDGPVARTAAVMAAMAPAAAADWAEGGEPEAFAGVTVLEAATAAEEAQAIAIALRQALETPGQTAALVTPDRVLARRVAAHCRRWGLVIDDSAGEPLRLTPPGALALALVEAMAAGFAPVALLAALKHPLAAAGDGRTDWLASVRQLDLALRGVRPPPGLDSIAEAIDAHFAERRARLKGADASGPKLAELDRAGRALAAWWVTTAAAIEPLGAIRDHRDTDLAELAAALRSAGTALAGDRLWSGTDGRALAALVERLEAEGSVLDAFPVEDAPALVAALLNDIAVRAAWGGHPRLRILGPLEAQLQRADLMILGGLNEGVWPRKPPPDPWLAPAIRAALGLPGLARATGLAAHDFVGGLAAPRVLVTRARRDASAPLVPSRFWLRLKAYAGELAPATDLLRHARRIDGGGAPQQRPPPAPAPPVARRPTMVALTAIDTLVTDPFAFYAQEMLRLRPLDPLDQDPTAADRGNRIHDVMERWTGGGGSGSLEQLQQLAEEMLASEGKLFPLLRALWAPRARRALGWAGAAMHAREAEGWQAVAAEAAGVLTLPNGIRINGRADRVDRHDDGRIAVIDYKTGRTPTAKQVRSGLANQLGLLLAMAAGGMLRSAGRQPLAGGAPGLIEYWKLSGGTVEGKIVAPLGGRSPVAPADHVRAVLDLAEAETTRLLQTRAAFVSKRHPGLGWTDFDHLARVAEWQNRPARRS